MRVSEDGMRPPPKFNHPAEAWAVTRLMFSIKAGHVLEDVIVDPLQDVAKPRPPLLEIPRQEVSFMSPLAIGRTRQEAPGSGRTLGPQRRDRRADGARGCA